MIRFLLFGIAIATATASLMIYLQGRSLPEKEIDLSTLPPAETQIVEEINVLVTGKNLPAQHKIQPEDLEWAPWPKKYIQPHFLLAENEHLQLSDIAGKYTQRPYNVGEPLDVNNLMNQRITRLSDRVENGMRAVSISVSPITTSGGLVRVDDYVDIIRVYTDSDESIYSTVILENIRILAVGSSIYSNNEESETSVNSPGTVTFELSPEQAVTLVTADFEGQLALALRTRSDHKSVAIDSAKSTLKKVVNEAKPVVSESDFEETKTPKHSIGVFQGETWVPHFVP